SADCNMRCRYCFYLEKSSLYPETGIHRMSDDTLKKLISSYMNTSQTFYNFGWQGGEPTLMGLEFYEKVTELQKRYGKAGSIVSNGLQTNGTKIDEDFARFLKKYKFLVGVSLDGPRYVHDHYRKFAGGGGTFEKVMGGIEILKRNNVEFNILVLVNDFNAGKAREIYWFLVDNGFYYQQYIPCVEYDNQGNLKPYSITGEQWGNFLIDLFNQWYPRHVYRVSIRLFDGILNKLTGRQAYICHMGENCNQYLVVEYNGDIYPCDFFVRKDLKLGNINNDSFQELMVSPAYLDFGKAKSNYSFICNSCQYLNLCYGDCLKYRNYIPENSTKLSILCSGWKMFYMHSMNIFRKIAEEI
ncbi:MAG: anaerobic sulfatase maturase, partial [Actinobacteria bacterium]|nr:anaerobic sulfatase maturase [Actinomycetota bacterium]